jgi:hypothetical protein
MMEPRTRAGRRFARDRSVIVGGAGGRLVTEVDDLMPVGGGQPLRRADRRPKRGPAPTRDEASEASPVADAETEYAQELAALAQAFGVDALPADQQPVGWADQGRQGGA